MFRVSESISSTIPSIPSTSALVKSSRGTGSKTSTGGGAEQRPVTQPRHRDQQREVRVHRRPQGLDVAALELGAQPLAVLEVEARRIAPGPDLRLHDDRHLDRPQSPRRHRAGDGEQPLDEASLLLERHPPSRHDQHVEVAARPQPSENGRAVEIGADEILREHVANCGEHPLELLLHRRDDRVKENGATLSPPRSRSPRRIMATPPTSSGKSLA